MSISKLPEYFPEIEPFQSGLLKVSDIHKIYFEQNGKPDGKPVLFVPCVRFTDLYIILQLGVNMKSGWTKTINRYSRVMKPREYITRKNDKPNIEAKQTLSTFRTKVNPLKEVGSVARGDHGGPGGGTSPRERRFFDPAVYRIILFDQRGAGKSQPPAELKENTTWDLVEDMEKLRKHLGVSKWLVFGGSWGSTLALAYAQTHPDKVKALVIRGILTFRRRELLWVVQDGANFIYPDKMEAFISPIPEVERGDIISAYHRRLTSDDEETRLKAAKAWSLWMTILLNDKETVKRIQSDAWALSVARLESHYFVNGGFFASVNQLLDNVDKIRHIPCTIVQGRYDVVCPMETAWLLHKKWPEADFHIVEDAGHSSKESGIASLLIEAVEKYQNL